MGNLWTASGLLGKHERMATPERLDDLVQTLDHEGKKDSLGFFYVFWGVMNTLGVWIFSLVWFSFLFWVVWIPCGIVLMMVMVQGKIRHDGRVLLTGININRIWLSLLAVLPLLIWLFPVVLGLYSPDWIFSLTTGWIALGLYTTGAYAGRPSIAWGALGFGVAAILFPFFPNDGAWIFTIANVFGLILPGLVSSYEERR